MFGEVDMNEQKSVKIMKDKSILLPQFTNASEGENLYFVYDGKSKVCLMNYEGYLGVMQKLFDYAKRKYGATSEFDLGHTEAMRYFMYNFFVSEEKVTKSRRIKLDKRFFLKLNPSDKVFVVGDGQRLDIYKDEDAYKLSLHK